MIREKRERANHIAEKKTKPYVAKDGKRFRNQAARDMYDEEQERKESDVN